MIKRVLLLALATAACGKAPDPAPAAPPEPTPPPVVEITALDYAFQAPDTIPGGWVTLRIANRGQELHHGQIARIGGGKTFADLAALDPTAPPPEWLELVGGPSAPPPGGALELTTKLEPGHYAFICMVPSPDGKLHIAKGMAKPFEVVAPAVPAAAPTATITASLSDYDFGLVPALTAGTHTIRVVTAPGQPHEIVIARLVPGKKAEDFFVWAENVFTVTLTPGDYALVCFIPDAKDGKPHATHGMIKTIKIT
ncbi:MAG: hypothetical protein FJ206_16285 [Gemmatimonadetes bacterium]|nr:hypothetical protein [Gemmatimonadota bacterium]